MKAGTKPTRLAYQSGFGNTSTWLYRRRPTASHRPFRRISNGLLRSGPFGEAEPSPNRLRWNPFPIPAKPADFLEGLFPLAGSGGPGGQAGVGGPPYRAHPRRAN